MKSNESTDQHGSSTVELVLVAPLLIALLLFVVFAAQGSHQAAAVKHAADSGARSASMVRYSQMSVVATRAVQADLAGSKLRCGELDVRTSFENLGRTRVVTVKVTCGVAGRDFLGLGIRARDVSAISKEVIDVYRAE